MSDDVFPDVRWGSDSSLLRKPAIAFSSTRFGSWLIRSAAPLDRKLLQRSHGRFTILGPIGAPTVLLTTTGRKSGQPRTNPLLYIRDNGRLVVVGSNFGHSTHPAWTANLLADPNGTVTLGSTIVPVVATPINGTEYEDLYTAFVNMASVYGGYRQKTDRTLRMFALTPQ